MEQNARIHVIPLSRLVDEQCLLCGKVIRRPDAVVAICTTEGLHWASLCSRHAGASERVMDEIEAAISVPSCQLVR